MGERVDHPFGLVLELGYFLAWWNCFGVLYSIRISEL